MQVASLGDYTAVVTNAYDSVTSSVATLLVIHSAAATPSVVNGVVDGFTVTDAGYGYTNAPLVALHGGGGTGATALAVVSNGVVVAITILDPGTSYTSPPFVVINPPSPGAAQVDLVKAVKPAFSDLFMGASYQLQLSADLTTWTNQGTPFIATDVVMEYPQYFDVDGWGGLFFRLQSPP